MSFKSTVPSALPFDPQALPRETKRHYISASDAEIKEMLHKVGANSLDDLYQHIPQAIRFPEAPDLPAELAYEDLPAALQEIASRNEPAESFLGDGLPHYQTPSVVEPVSAIRNLSTAYTPYQPERSQGTLMTHWIYQCLMSQITGFEAINSSLYDRSTAIFEAMATVTRLKRKANTVLLSEGIFPSDREVIETLTADTPIRLRWVPLDPETGRTDPESVRKLIADEAEDLAGFVFPQINSLGLLEEVDTLTNTCADSDLYSIAVIDPILLGTGGLKPPADFGTKGADVIVGEAQHLAIGPNFGGPGLGIFGTRFNETSKSAIRQSPGRYVGTGKDNAGRESLLMVLSTREQHIRKDKATSNICSNQAFLATIAGAALLERGEDGMAEAFRLGREQAEKTAAQLTALPGIRLAFPETPFVNEFLLEVPLPVPELLQKARQAGLHAGVDVSERLPDNRHLLKISFSDREVDCTKLIDFFAREIATPEEPASPHATTIPALPAGSLRSGKLDLLSLSTDEIASYYRKLGDLNVSPDDACYPLGSCTMKYNPHINDWAASIPGFTETHPQAPIESVQGNFYLLHQIQEWFKKITGLPGVTTQPVAGAQGELVGIKMFQAYHRDRDQGHRDVVLIPDSAHGTNFATAIMAGFRSRKVDGLQTGIVLLRADDDGTIDFEDCCAKIETYRDRLAGVMITNPNTCGVFENRFHEIAEKVHQAGGLVYMDGANMNAIAGWCDLNAMGVDAVHNNLHKTWTIPHGGGGPGDAIVAVSERLLPYLPGHQIEKQGDHFVPVRPPKSIGSFHRHFGNFAHKVRAYTYLLRLGHEGVRRMTAFSVLSARYCFEQLRNEYPTLPAKAQATPRMHEFILTLAEKDFQRLEQAGIPRAQVITRVGKLFLDFGFHAPTVAWPETFGLMIEPTESYSQSELDRFCEAVLAIRQLLRDCPQVLHSVPHFTPVDRVDEVSANRAPQLHQLLTRLPDVPANRLDPKQIAQLPINEISRRLQELAG